MKLFIWLSYTVPLSSTSVSEIFGFVGQSGPEILVSLYFAFSALMSHCLWILNLLFAIYFRLLQEDISILFG